MCTVPGGTQRPGFRYSIQNSVLRLSHCELLCTPEPVLGEFGAEIAVTSLFIGLCLSSGPPLVTGPGTHPPRAPGAQCPYPTSPPAVMGCSVAAILCTPPKRAILSKLSFSPLYYIVDSLVVNRIIREYLSLENTSPPSRRVRRARGEARPHEQPASRGPSAIARPPPQGQNPPCTRRRFRVLSTHGKFSAVSDQRSAVSSQRSVRIARRFGPSRPCSGEPTQGGEWMAESSRQLARPGMESQRSGDAMLISDLCMLTPESRNPLESPPWGWLDAHRQLA